MLLLLLLLALHSLELLQELLRTPWAVLLILLSTSFGRLHGRVLVRCIGHGNRLPDRLSSTWLGLRAIDGLSGNRLSDTAWSCR